MRRPRTSLTLAAAAAATLLTAIAPGAAGAATRRAPRLDLSNASRCDFIAAPGDCLAPFPDDWFTVADRRTPTGRRVHLQLDSMPANTKGVHIDPQWWNQSDGFPPGSTILVKVPGLQNQGAFTKTGLNDSANPGASLRRDARAIVIDARTGKRQAVWAELDANAATDAERTLEIHPAKNFTEGHRYIVALRNLRTASGAPIAAPPGFRIYRDGLRSSQRTVNARRPRMEAILRTLRRAHITRQGLYLAWDFTVASTQNLTGRALAIRNDAFRRLGDTKLADNKVTGKAPAYTISKVTDYTRCTVADGQKCPAGTDRDLRRQVEGTFDVPCYLDSPGCTSGGAFVLDKNGLPTPPKDGNTDKAPFVCNIPFAAQDGTGVHKLLPSLYGHGLFGDIGEARRSRNVHQLGDENGVVVCATDFQGMADEDISHAVGILQDLSGFHKLADRLQQGFLNFLFLARLLHHPQGLAADAAFQLDGQPVIDTSQVQYYGNSQGGIQGGPVTALSPDIRRSVLYVPGMTYSVLLPRSVDFDDPSDDASFADVVFARPPFAGGGGYAPTGDHPLILDLMQMLWDRGEPSGYAQQMTAHPLPGTPSHTVLIEMSIGDHQVANVQAQVEARTIGARTLRIAYDPGRNALRDPNFGMPPLGRLPQTGTAFIPWDIGPLRTQDGKTMGTPLPPVGNLPNTQGQDPHDYVIEHSPAIRRQIATYLKTGQIVDVCGGAPCRTPDWAGPAG